MVEPKGEAGWYPDEGYLAGIRKLCNEYNVCSLQMKTNRPLQNRKKWPVITKMFGPILILGKRALLFRKCSL